MHADEHAIDEARARKLITEQFPQWAPLDLRAVASSGTDHALYRLGDSLVIRFPRIPSAALQLEKECEWLSWLAPRLPLAIPEPVAIGAPAEDFPSPWAVYTWIDGHDASTAPPESAMRAAEALAGFVDALWRIETRGGPVPGPHNFFRGVPLAERDDQTRTALDSLRGEVDSLAATTRWEAALEASPSRGPAAWIHGDLHPTNILVRDQRVAAVIDFGGLAVGDPACDLMAAWTVFSADARARFRNALAVDDAAWTRGRGWALSVALIALPSYRDTNPVFARIARHTIDEVLAG